MSLSAVIFLLTFFTDIISLNVGANLEGTLTLLLVRDETSLTLEVDSVWSVCDFDEDVVLLILVAFLLALAFAIASLRVFCSD